MIRIFSVAFFLLAAISSFGQDSLQVVEKKDKNFRFLPLPAVAVTPTTGLMLGVAPGAYWTLGDPSITSPSTALGSIIYTLKQQWLITAKATTYFNGDQWNMLTDIRYFINSQPSYGLGTGPQSAKPVGSGGVDFSDNPYQPILTEQMMDYNYLRVHNTVMKKYKETRFFMGLGEIRSPGLLLCIE